MTTSTRHALLVGGSAGIGLGVALSVAPLVTKLTICSRSCPPDLIAIIKARNPDADVVFERLDLSLMHEVREFTTKHAATNFDWIVLTAGFLHLNGRTETVEGLDDMMGAVYYGRFMLLHDLLPNLNRPGVRVLNVLGAGQAASGPELDDLGLNHPHSFLHGVHILKLYSDLMAQALSEHAPQASFMHIYPGWVYTGSLKSFPWYIRLPVNAMSALFATTIETCGERMTLALTKDEFATGWKLLNERAEEVPKTKFHTDELKDLVWDHTIQTIDDALKK